MTNEDSKMQRMIDFDSGPQKEPEKVATDTKLPPPEAEPLVRPDRQTTYPDCRFSFEWPDASELHDRDTISVDRVSDSATYQDHRFVIKRGDTVKAFYGVKSSVGTVTGISHANREVRVSHDGRPASGVWLPLGYIYPAPEPQNSSPKGTPLSAVVQSVNAAHEPEGGFTEADLVPQPYTFSEFKRLVKRGLTHESFASYRSDFKRIVASKEAILAELQATYKAPQLKALAARMGELHARTNTKTKNATAMYERMLGSFSLDSMTSYSMGETYEQAITKKVLAVTAEQWEEHQALVAKKRAANQAAIENPETLEDFARFVETKGEAALSNEQMARWDKLHADRARELRAKQGPTATVTQFEGEDLDGVQFSITEGYHTKRDCPLWIVQLDSRVERATFRELNGKAKMLGGRYSSFKRSEAGFQFFSEDAAARFVALLQGDTDRTDILEGRKTRKEQSASERLHELADAMAERAEQTIEASKASLQNTARRAEMQAGIRGRAYADLALARTMHSLATALSTGEAVYLDGVRQKVQIETLNRTLSLAKWARIRSLQKQHREGELAYNFRLDEEEGKPISEDDIRFAEYPTPFIYRRNLVDAINHCYDKKGVKLAAAKMSKRIKGMTADSVVFADEYDIETLRDFLSRAKSAGFDTRWLDASLEPYTRLKRARIENIHELRAALREYLPHKASTRGDDPVQIAERELIGKKLPGFFPTPRPIIEQMLDQALIDTHSSVLEPSCGKGDIVQAVLDQYPNTSVAAIEQNRSLAEVLAAKEIEVEFGDFLEHRSRYDRIVMNPPFERGADIEHVRHAFVCLNPGGRLVSVMSEGPFNRSDSRAAEFRAWLDAVGGVSTPLPEGAFTGNEAFRQTGVNTRLVVIDKP